MKHKYPCKDCIIKPVCSTLCGLVNTLKTEVHIQLLEYKRCVDCGSTKCIEHSHNRKLNIYQHLLCCECGSVYYSDLGNSSKVFIRYNKYQGNGYTKGTSTTFAKFILKYKR
jgi:hypothetical protein